jgi:hypothetical protein
MNHWMWPVSLVGILSTAVVCGTDMFFLTVGRPALRLASPSAGTEVMVFFHMFGDARMPIWGVSAILSNSRSAASCGCAQADVEGAMKLHDGHSACSFQPEGSNEHRF